MVKLKEIAIVSAGQGAPQGEENYCDDGIPFVKAGNLAELIAGKDIQDIQKVSEDVARKHRLKIYKRGTILFAKSGMSCLKGYVYVLPCDSYVVSHLACITPNEELSNYLQYYFKYNKPNALVKDPSYPSISLSDIGSLNIDIKNDIQRAYIVKVLDILSLVIKKQRVELSSLNDLIKARFVEMFGDLRSNEKGFETHKGSELFKFSSGKFLPESKRLKSGIPVYGGNGIAWYTDSHLIDYPTIIVGRVGALCGNIHTTHTPVWITDNAIFIKEFKTNKHSIEFLTEMMKLMNFYQYADFSGQPKITQKPLESLEYITPPISLQNQFAAFVAQVDKSKFAVQKSLEKTQLLFDSLMQEYFG